MKKNIINWILGSLIFILIYNLGIYKGNHGNKLVCQSEQCIMITPSGSITIGDKQEKIVINYKVLAQIESNNNSLAFNPKSGARGLYQITPIVLLDYNHRIGIFISFNYDDLFDINCNYRIAKWYLESRIPQMLKYYRVKDTLENRLICYNAGIKYLVDKKELPKETIEYLKKYKELNDRI